MLLLLLSVYLGIVGAALAVAAGRPASVAARVCRVEGQAHALGAHALLLHEQPHEAHVLELLVVGGQIVADAVGALLGHRVAHEGARALEPAAAAARLAGVDLSVEKTRYFFC